MYRALSSKFGKGPLAKKIIDLMSKLGTIIDIKHNYGSKIYPKNQVILDCFYAKHKCLSDILIWVIDSHKIKWSVKKQNRNIFFIFFITFLIGKSKHAIGKKGGYFPLGMGPKFGPAGMADKAPMYRVEAQYDMEENDRE